MIKSAISTNGRSPSQSDVARRAGVSRTTVSYVINGNDATIPAATQARVWAAIEDLGFRPNLLARNLRLQQTNVIGLLTDDIATTPYAVAIVKGAQDAAHRAGRTLLIVDTHGALDAVEEAVALLNAWRVDAVVYATDYHREVRLPASIHDRTAVLVDCFERERRLATVVPDELQGGRLATETLLAVGHRRIAFINGPSSFPASAGRLAGYRAALEAAGIDFDPALVREGDWWQETGLAHTTDLMSLPDPPTAIFCANDWMAMGAYDALRELGRAIPGDVSVIGFDNREEIAAHMRPQLTTVALPYYDMGRWAIEHLVGAAGDNSEIVPQVTLACPVIERGSVGVPARA